MSDGPTVGAPAISQPLIFSPDPCQKPERDSSDRARANLATPFANRFTFLTCTAFGSPRRCTVLHARVVFDATRRLDDSTRLLNTFTVLPHVFGATRNRIVKVAGRKWAPLAPVSKGEPELGGPEHQLCRIWGNMYCIAKGTLLEYYEPIASPCTVCIKYIPTSYNKVPTHI